MNIISISRSDIAKSHDAELQFATAAFLLFCRTQRETKIIYPAILLTLQSIRTPNFETVWTRLLFLPGVLFSPDSYCSAPLLLPGFSKSRSRRSRRDSGPPGLRSPCERMRFARAVGGTGGPRVCCTGHWMTLCS